MERRKFLAGGALGAVGLATGCDCGDYVEATEAAHELAAGGKKRRLKMVTTWPKDFPGTGGAAERTAQFITEMTGGAIEVDVYAAGELVPAFESFDAVSTGAADFYHGAEYYWIGKSKAYAFFTAVPFGMTASEIMAWTEFGGGQQLWDELSAQFNIKPFAAGNTGLQLGGWYRKAINSIEDLRGLKIRMPGLGGEMLRRVGASAVAISGGEIFPALQSGAIDGTEWIGPWNDLAFGFYREAKYYYWPGFHEPGAQLAVGVNLDLWKDFSPAEQSIVAAACHRANHLCLAEFTHFNALALKQLVEEHDIELREMPEDVTLALGGAAQEVLREFDAADPFSKRVYDSYREELARVAEWSRISDGAFLNARRKAFSL